MDFKRTNFENGKVLTAPQLNNLEKAILDLYSASYIGNHCVNRPYTFSGKKGYFFGDSITYGYVKDADGSSHRATNGGYPQVFSDKVGLTSTNYAVSGSLFGNYNGLNTIPSKVKSTTLNCDFLFVAGGINDWQCGISLTEFRTEVESLCQYLKENYTGEVIFITPINHAGRKPIVTPVAEVQDYRNIITELALTYGFSVVQGNLLNFPNINSAPTYISTMFSDYLHPNEAGYELFARQLVSVLC